VLPETRLPRRTGERQAGPAQKARTDAVSPDHRPLLAIVYGEGSTSAFALSETAQDVCTIAWVVDSSRLDDAWIVRLLRKLGRVVDIAGQTGEEAARSVGALGPAGIVAYADAQMATASALAERLGLDYHQGEVADRLLDKVAQRAALRSAGLPVPACVPVPARPTPAALDELVDGIEFPVVLKPRQGAASRDTHMVRDEAALRMVMAARSTDDTEPTMVVESYMEGASPPPSQQFGDYVSVESVVVDGTISHLAVTGRLPQAPPFRETGLVIPTDFSASVVEDLLQVATAAIAAVGVRIGCLHTEIKVTDEGPRVIEVNGRIGGFVPQVLRLASPGTDLIGISRRVAIGERLVFPDLVPTAAVGYVLVQQPPIGAQRVASVEGLHRLAAYPGVDAVSLSRPPGHEVDWRKGSHEYVFSVLGTVRTHEDMRTLQQFVDDEVTVTYD
jgi:glutathione synthase/RimK-type ligase-like ATP-grasp enzyme